MPLVLMLFASLLPFLPTVLAGDTEAYPLTAYRDESYGIKVAFGTPPQAASLRLAEDFKADDQIVVAGAECEMCCRKTRYNSTRSLTSTCFVEETYEIDGLRKGCEDTVSVLGMSFKEFVFYEVTSAHSYSPFVKDPWDGFFDLESTYGDSTNGINVTGLYMRRTCATGFAEDAGTITANGLDSKNCGDAGSPLELRSFNYDWPSVQLSTAQVDGSEIQGGPWRAFFTLNSAEIIVPQAVFDSLVQRWHLEKDGDDWAIDCNTVGTLNLALLDDSGHAQNLSVDVSQLLYHVGDKCVLRISTSDFDEYNHEQYWHFGLPLFRSYCTLVDYSRWNRVTTIAFAPQTAPGNGTCVYQPPIAIATCEAATTTPLPNTDGPTLAPPLESTTNSAGRLCGLSAAYLTLLFLLITTATL